MTEHVYQSFALGRRHGKLGECVTQRVIPVCMLLDQFDATPEMAHNIWGLASAPAALGQNFGDRVGALNRPSHQQQTPSQSDAGPLDVSL